MREKTMSTWNPTKLTAMHYRHLELGATMLDDCGWQRPAFYASKEEDLSALKQKGGICDISPNGKLMLQGVDLDALLASDFPGAEPPEVGRAARLGAQGRDDHLIGPALICRLSDDEALAVTPPDGAQTVINYLAGRLRGCAHLIDVSAGFAGIKAVGPQGHHLLAKLTDLDLNPGRFTDLSCAQTRLAELYVMVVRCDDVGPPSYEVYVERSYGEFLWDAMLEAGHELGIGPVGVEALKLLPSEAE